MKESFERSSLTEDRIEFVRKGTLSQEGRLEQARRLRGEIVLQNAQLTKHLLQTLDGTPFISDEEFRELTETAIRRQEIIVNHPEAVEDFINQIAEVRERIYQTLQGVNDEAQQAKTGIGKAIFLKLAGRPDLRHFKKLVPIEPGSMQVDKNYPLAPVIFVPDDQFDLIDTRKNVGGFYSEKGLSHTLTDEEKAAPEEKSSKETIDCPIIAVKHYPQNYDILAEQNVIDHEQQHAENAVFQKVRLKKVPNEDGTTSEVKVTWARSMNNPEQVKKIAQGLLADPTAVIEGETPEQGKELVFRYAIDRVKDEILAYTRGSQSDRMGTILTNPNGLYNYFADDLGIPKDSNLYADLWEAYVSFVKQRCFLVERMNHAYQVFGLDDRRKVLPWILAQFPIEEWLEEPQERNYEESPLLTALEMSPQQDVTSLAPITKKYRGSQLRDIGLLAEADSLLNLHNKIDEGVHISDISEEGNQRYKNAYTLRKTVTDQLQHSFHFNQTEFHSREIEEIIESLS